MKGNFQGNVLFYFHDKNDFTVLSFDDEKMPNLTKPYVIPFLYYLTQAKPKMLKLEFIFYLCLF